MSAEPPVGVREAGEALEFWLRRLRKLPHRRRADRREARAMVARWERRHRAAVLAQRRSSLAGRALVALGAEALLAPRRPRGGLVERRRRVRADAALAAEARRAAERAAKARAKRTKRSTRRGPARLVPSRPRVRRRRRR